MGNIYFLSIRDNYVRMIISGLKKWEFRKNPNFGIFHDKKIDVGDILFLISTTSEELSPKIECMCEILSILRKDELIEFFKDKKTKRWTEAGCSDNSDRDWDFFTTNILYNYSTAIKIKPYELNPVIEVSHIVRKSNGRPWMGIGMLGADDFVNYSVGEQSVMEYFRDIAQTILNKEVILL